MKKNLKWAAVAAVVIVAVLAIVYRAVNRVPSENLTPSERVLAIFEDGGCVSCHSENPKLPFYAELPVMGKIVKQDSDSGYRAFDIVAMNEALKRGSSVHPVDLAKVEKVVLDGRMPMAKYYLVHWGSSLTRAKTDVVLDWAWETRRTMYDDAVCEALATEPVRPIDFSVPVDPAKVALGKALFHDPRLSADNTVSCSSCHGLNTGGVDNKQYSEGVGGQFGGVNAPTVYNAYYNFVQFWDGRAATLADQAAGPPLNPVEMACESFDEIVAKLAADKEFSKAFRAVYPEGLSQTTITDAIAEFEKTLLTPDSRFDLYLRGDETALSSTELNGYELFKKYDCATCHVGKNLGGLSYEPMGLRADYFGDRGLELTNEDNGRYKETSLERDRHRFKVPGLRNVALTWPYFHDGTRATLEEAVRDMAVYQTGVSLKENEVGDITAFLYTLTGKVGGEFLTNDNSK